MKKKSHKMDPKLVAENEISYIAKTYKIPTKIVRAVKKKLNTVSRQRIYKELREMGYVIKTRYKPKG